MPADRTVALGDNLTARERQVLTHLADGYTAEQIAASLYISRSTVKQHIAGLFTKLGARNAPHAVAIACRTGILATKEDA
jgi:DNA-binding CsgD family transcriptional regulator